MKVINLSFKGYLSGNLAITAAKAILCHNKVQGKKSTSQSIVYL